jgi:hypothetical protein
MYTILLVTTEERETAQGNLIGYGLSAILIGFAIVYEVRKRRKKNKKD